MAKKPVLPTVVKKGMIVVMCLAAVVGSAFYLVSNKAKTVYRVHSTPAYTATFFNERCSDKTVLAMLSPAQVEALGDRFKSGTVVINKPDGQETRQFCYVIADKNDVFEVIAFVDDTGVQGMLMLETQESKDEKKANQGKI